MGEIEKDLHSHYITSHLHLTLRKCIMFRCYVANQCTVCMRLLIGRQIQVLDFFSNRRNRYQDYYKWDSISHWLDIIRKFLVKDTTLKLVLFMIFFLQIWVQKESDGVVYDLD